ncbi:MAG: hypothetical protein IPJ74_14280 [Saprospiraceae bacterium]|nr:hypothetical protein [Saprospiraceae bacterium]
MLKFFRSIRRRLLDSGKVKRDALYAIGEILLVVIGILIALQVNNWNEGKKDRKTELYVLKEILNNLHEDERLINNILKQRVKAKKAIENLQNYLLNDSKSKDSLPSDLTDVLTFERYYPINNAYEVLKSKGLKLSNNKIASQLSRYYDFEQNKVRSSIYDIEQVLISIYHNPNSIRRFISSIKRNKKVGLIDLNDPIMHKELFNEMIFFENNNAGTIEKIQSFIEFNNEITAELEKELKSLEKE